MGSLPGIVTLAYKSHAMTHRVAPFRMDSFGTAKGKMMAYDTNACLVKKFMIEETQGAA
jgi:hypothetical protein